MRGFAILLLITFIAAAVPAPAAAVCEPGGWFKYWYDHIANGWPEANACWNPIRMAYVSVNSCGWVSAAYQFGYAGTISQSFTIPTGFTGTDFTFDYTIDFIDPNNDGANNLVRVTIRDLTTNTILASDSYNGYMPDVTCAKRNLSFSGNLAGHTLRVSFSGSTGYSDTKIIVRHMALWQTVIE